MNIYLFIFLINFFFYFLLLMLLNNFFLNKYYYPFRKLDIINFIINTTIFSLINFFYFGLNLLIIIIIINLNFFYISFHLQNMVITSPRTKIIIDIFNKTNKKKYTDKNIVDNRIKRLLSNQQILIVKKKIQLNKKNKTLYLINLIFKLIKKL